MLVYNAIQCPDGTVIESRHRHDFVCHTDKNGQKYCVDGGLDYLRRLGNLLECKELSLHASASHYLVREVFKWGSYGVSGNEALKYIAVMDMTDEHVQAIIDNVKHIPEELMNIFEREVRFRKN